MASSFLVIQTNPRKTKPNVNIASLKIPNVLSLAMLCQVTVNAYPLGQRCEAPAVENKNSGSTEMGNGRAPTVPALVPKVNSTVINVRTQQKGIKVSP